jgi:hypothetical protein
MGDVKEREPQNFRANHAENKIKVWEYESYFREYAFLMGSKGKDALETLENYPARIELGRSWHRALDSMRSETASDRNERFAIVGYIETSRDFYFPEQSEIGEPYAIRVGLVNHMLVEAREQHGVDSIIGDLHTHHYVGPLTFGDFYSFLDRSWFHQPYIRGLVNPQENIFAFQTRETYAVSDFGIPGYSSSEGFKNYWRKKAGFMPSDKPHHIRRAVPTADMWSANIAIARAHRLALYRGKPEQDLIRAYP